jgi:hypothetical protein
MSRPRCTWPGRDRDPGRHHDRERFPPAGRGSRGQGAPLLGSSTGCWFAIPIASGPCTTSTISPASHSCRRSPAGNWPGGFDIGPGHGRGSIMPGPAGEYTSHGHSLAGDRRIAAAPLMGLPYLHRGRQDAGHLTLEGGGEDLWRERGRPGCLRRRSWIRSYFRGGEPAEATSVLRRPDREITCRQGAALSASDAARVGACFVCGAGAVARGHRDGFGEKDALGVAVLAYEAWHNRPGTLPSLTACSARPPWGRSSWARTYRRCQGT